jgi:hypothetical protein
MRIASLSLVGLLLFVAGGCESTTPSVTNAASHVMAEGTQRAVLISGNGGSTTIYLPTEDPEKPMMLCTAGAETCPECKAAAIKYFETGVLEPKCTKCGATRTLLVPSTPNVGHQ